MIMSAAVEFGAGGVSKDRSRGNAVENRSGIIASIRSRPIWEACRLLQNVAMELQRNTAQSLTATQPLDFWVSLRSSHMPTIADVYDVLAALDNRPWSCKL